MRNNIELLTIATLLLSANVAFGQDDDEAESTIRLMGAAEAELPGVVIEEISLPEALSEDSAAVENATQGLINANENRLLRREDGLLTADDAREQSAEMAEQAQDNRESRGRSEDRPEPQMPSGPPNN